MPFDPRLAPFLTRIGTWSAQAQAAAVASLTAIERTDLQQQGAQAIGPAALASVREGLAQADRCEFADSLVTKLYRDYNL